MNWKDPEEVKAYHRAYRQAHRDEINAWQKVWRETHKESCSKSRKKYIKTHRKERKEYNNQLNQAVKFEVLGHYSVIGHPNCPHCRIDDLDVLTIDHVNNDGAAHRKEQGTGSALYVWLKRNNYPEGYQVLCCNCNMKKEVLRRRA